MTTVTDADREAAAAWYRTDPNYPGESELAEAFASHRIAGERAMQERAAEVATDAERLALAAGQFGAAVAALDIFTEIKALTPGDSQ